MKSCSVSTVWRCLTYLLFQKHQYLWYRHCSNVTRLSLVSLPMPLRKVRVRGMKSCRIPGGTIQVVPVTCTAQYSSTMVLFEPSDQGLPAGLFASPALVCAVVVLCTFPL